MSTEKSYKAAIFWKNCCEKDFFTKMLSSCDEKYGVLILDGNWRPSNTLCIFKGINNKDRICVQCLPSMAMKTFAMKNVLGFALLQQREAQTEHINGDTLDNRRCNLGKSDRKGKSEARNPPR